MGEAVSFPAHPPLADKKKLAGLMSLGESIYAMRDLLAMRLKKEKRKSLRRKLEFELRGLCEKYKIPMPEN